MDLTKEQIIELSRSDKYEYPDVFDSYCGLDEIVDQCGKELTSTSEFNETRNAFREATLIISSWVGLDDNGIHYYGTIKIDGVDLKDGYDNIISNTTNNPLLDSEYKIKLRRYLTQKEIDDDPKRWEYYNESSEVESFNSIDEVINFAKLVFKTRFSGRWAFYLTLQNDFLIIPV